MNPIRFETAWRYQVPGQACVVTFDRRADQFHAPFEKRVGVRVAFLDKKLSGGGLIREFYETQDIEEVRKLFAVRSPIRCVNPQDIVDQGMMTFDEVRSRYDVVEPAADVVVAEPEKKDDADLPDFALMNMNQVAEWANEQGLYVKRRKYKDDYVEDVVAAYQKKKESE